EALWERLWSTKCEYFLPEEYLAHIAGSSFTVQCSLSRADRPLVDGRIKSAHPMGVSVTHLWLLHVSVSVIFGPSFTVTGNWERHRVIQQVIPILAPARVELGDRGQTLEGPSVSVVGLTPPTRSCPPLT